MYAPEKAILIEVDAGVPRHGECPGERCCAEKSIDLAAGKDRGPSGAREDEH